MRHAFFALAMAAATPAFADTGHSSSATGIANATIIQPITVTVINELDFGNVASRDAGAVEVLLGSPLVLYSGGAHLACVSHTDCPHTHPASFTVSGEAGRSYTISTPQSLSIAPYPATGGQPLLVDAITVQTASRPSSGASGLLDATGHDRFEIGGRLVLPAGLPPARIITRITVIVAYG